MSEHLGSLAAGGGRPGAPGPRGGRLGRALARLALLAVSLALAAIAGEVALARLGARPVTAGGGSIEIYDPLLGWRPRPGLATRLKAPEFDVAVRINAQGFRADREVPDARGARPRLVAVGDSFTFGEGVEGSETYVAQLERGGVEAVNLGVPGYGVGQALLMLESRGLRFRPDVALLGLYTPDVFRTDDAAHGSYQQPDFDLAGGRLVVRNLPVPPPGSPPPPLDLARRFRLTRFVADRLEHLGWGDVWPVNEAVLRRLAGSARRAGARPLAVVLPTREEVYGGALSRTLQGRTIGRVEAILRRAGIDFADAAPDLREAARRDPGTRLYYAVNGHMTAAGHRIVAAAILRHLADQPKWAGRIHPVPDLAPEPAPAAEMAVGDR